MRLFRWMSASDILPRCDLRRCGWVLAPADAGEPVRRTSVAIAPVSGVEAARWITLLGAQDMELRKWTILSGVESGEERARYLGLGFGDVLPACTCLSELEARARRVARQAASLPGERSIGALRLDLMARDGFVAERPVGLHPREFALAWRLAERPGSCVSKRQLLADVWRTHHMPETNSIAVHVFRLRAKLALAGLEGIVETAPDGSYRMDMSAAMPAALAGGTALRGSHALP